MRKERAMPKRTKPSTANDTTPPPTANDTTPPPPAAAGSRARRSTRAKRISNHPRPEGNTTDELATQPADAVEAGAVEVVVDTALGTDAQPNEQEIRQHAYHLYLERGGAHGRDFDDWVRAEQELKRKRVKH
jgi:hypothetical protein